MSLETISEVRSHGGVQGVYRHASAATGTDMTFSLFMPPEVERGEPLPVLWYLSGLTCSHANVTEKGEYRAACAANGGTIGFACDSPEEVDAWQQRGIAAGGTAIEDPPGIRSNAFGSLYLAYLRDPDGNKLCGLHRVSE